MFYLCVLPLCSAFVFCLCVLPLCSAFVFCLCVLPLCSAFVFCLCVCLCILPLCSAFVFCLCVLPLCSAFVLPSLRPLSYAVASKLLQRSSCLELIQNRKSVERLRTKNERSTGLRSVRRNDLRPFSSKILRPSESQLDDCGLERSERAHGANGGAERARERSERSERVRVARESTIVELRLRGKFWS